MSEMLGRVALALAPFLQRMVDEEGYPPLTLDEAAENTMPWARAAIEAMREPTEAMCLAGDAINCHTQTEAGNYWTAMIDAALGEAK